MTSWVVDGAKSALPFDPVSSGIATFFLFANHFMSSGGIGEPVPLTDEEAIESAYRKWAEEQAAGEEDNEGAYEEYLEILNNAKEYGLTDLVNYAAADDPLNGDTTDFLDGTALPKLTAEQVQAAVTVVDKIIYEQVNNGYPEEQARSEIMSVLDAIGIDYDKQSFEYIGGMTDKDGMISKRYEVTEDPNQAVAGGAAPDPDQILADIRAASSGNDGGSTDGGSTAGAGDWVYNDQTGVFEQVGSEETFIPIPGTYTNGQVVPQDQAQTVFGEWGDTNPNNPDTVDEQPGSGKDYGDIILTGAGGGTTTGGTTGDGTSGDGTGTDGTTGDQGSGTSGQGDYDWGDPNAPVEGPTNQPTQNPTPDPSQNPTTTNTTSNTTNRTTNTSNTSNVWNTSTTNRTSTSDNRSYDNSVSDAYNTDLDIGLQDKSQRSISYAAPMTGSLLGDYAGLSWSDKMNMTTGRGVLQGRQLEGAMRRPVQQIQPAQVATNQSPVHRTGFFDLIGANR